MSAVEKLRSLEADIAAASARQQDLRQQKEAAVRAVQERREALVNALESNLDGSPEATAAQKALEKAHKDADQPWDAKIEAAGRLIQQAHTKRGVYLTNNIDALLTEMSSPAVKWPERALEALEALYSVAREYDVIGGPIERLAQEAGLTAVRVPLNPLERFVSDLNRMRQVSLHAPIPATVTPAQIDPLDDPDDDVRETARAAWFPDGKAV